MLYIGIDVGGTTVKGILIDENGKLYSEDRVPSEKGEKIADAIITLCNRLMQKASDRVAGVGIGCPGVIDSENGRVVFAGNLQLKDFPLVQVVKKALNLPVKITNDANAAVLGEAKFGAAKDVKNSILVTLGTGVGGGIIIDGKLFEGNKSAGAEIGHAVIERGGAKCTCGREGCFEAYSSATALINRTKKAMEEDAGSLMWEVGLDKVNGRTAFDYYDKDVTAKEVVDWYIERLACGLTNLGNIFRPQVIMLGGGVSGQGERLTAPVQKLVDSELFAADYAPIKITTATLGSSAGAYGAAALVI